MKYLMILRGCQGSGKSTYAKKLTEKFKSLFKSSAVICSADDYFMVNGVYNFNASKLGHAHSDCYDKVTRAMAAEVKLIVLDNTNVKTGDYKNYLKAAETYGYQVRYKVFDALDDESIETYIKRNVHNVPADTIKRMAKTLKESLGE